MNEIDDHLQELTTRLNELRSSHLQMQEEINRIEEQLTFLRSQLKLNKIHEGTTPINIPAKHLINISASNKPTYQKAVQQDSQKKSLFGISQSLENFVGTNLISKVGILITIIGVFIGARYAIDKELISPTARIILAYGFAVSLAVIGLWLKPKYKAFSAILLGGSIAIVYFTTYIGFGYFELFSQPVAFVLMFITTIAAVGLALWYDQKVIALLGQVAAYAVPLLLSTGGGKAGVLFTYITIINTGLIILSFRRNWKIVYRIAFGITWLMYFYWINFGDDKTLSWNWTLFFLAVCFITFYITYLSYKIFRKELYNFGEISILLLNGLLFYYLGYLLIEENYPGSNALALFTIANAAIHLLAGYAIHNADLADRTVKLFLLGQGLTFITIAIPVKLDGSWVTLLWSLESAIMMFIATRSNRKLYFQLGAAVLVIAVISLLQDWATIYTSDSTFNIRPFFHPTFFTSLFTAGCLLYAAVAFRRKAHLFETTSLFKKFYSGLLPLLFIIILFSGFFLEIDLYFNLLRHGIMNEPGPSYPLKTVMLLVYSLLFCSAGLYVNRQFIRHNSIHYFFLVASFIALSVQLTDGLIALRDMQAGNFQKNQAAIPGWIRYLSFAAVAVLWLNILMSKKVFTPSSRLRIFLSIALNLTVLTILCNEYLNWVDVFGYSNQYKLGLSILWALYGLVILFIGLIRQIKHLRITAIVLFGITIAKVFVYDLSSLTTISKTIVMIILGVLLLTASFLYNKYVNITTVKENQ